MSGETRRGEWRGRFCAVLLMGLGGRISLITFIGTEPAILRDIFQLFSFGLNVPRTELQIGYDIAYMVSNAYTR